MEASISGRLRSRRGFPWTMAALLMRTVGGPSCSVVSLNHPGWPPVAMRSCQRRVGEYLHPSQSASQPLQEPPYPRHHTDKSSPPSPPPSPTP